ncbi:ATP-grasp domain-containing protein [Azospirillum agricola]|uniref:hypothetical protein n=1 Tax=Azospirillum agricola TaxID=1720247 RepID=UPI000A0EF226|nr:hypothetical protein [Azospirillum agricola]SMH62281.1 hypothetical protein SAMN02982994_6215 [Azospirillum lipoferum]
MACLLITSAGSLVADAILRCLDRLRPGLTIVGVNSVAAPTAFGCDRLYRVPNTANRDEYEAALRAVLERETPDLALAGRDEDIPALAAAAAFFPHTAIPLPPPGLAPVFADKARSHGFAVRHGLPFAPTALGGDAARAMARAHGFPLIAKPRSGAGSQGVLLLRAMAELERVADDARLIVQPFLDPQGIGGAWEAALQPDAMPWSHGLTDLETTVELVVGPDGRVVASCCDQGVTAPPLRRAVRLIEDGAVAEVGLAWAAALAAAGHRGPLNIQGKRLADGRFVPYEIGARFGGTTVARALLGRNLVRALVSSWLGWPSEPDEAPRPVSITGLGLSRLSLPQPWRRRFEEAGEWEAPADRSGRLARPALWPRDEDEAGTAPAGALPASLGGAAPDRMALARHAVRHDLPFVPTVASPEGVRTFAGAPLPLLVVKPRQGDGPVRLLAPREAMAALETDGLIAQPALGAAALAEARALWAALPGLPWLWSASDRVGVVEGEVGGDGLVTNIRSALCEQRGGTPLALHRLNDAPECAAMTEALRRWGASLAPLDHRGPLRLTGSWDAAGRWLPFTASGSPLGLPAADSAGGMEVRVLRPMPG